MAYIMMLARVFSKEEYAKDFINNGKFRLNTLNFFKGYDEEHANNIGDVYEGIRYRATAEQEVKVTIEYNGKREEIEVQEVYSHDNYVLNNNVFCLYAPSVDIEKKYTLEAMREIVAFQEDAEKLGDYLVIITNPDEFFERVRKTILKLGYTLKRGLVEYVDFNNPVHVPIEKIGFVKSDEFSHQKEYRLMVDDGRNIDEYIELQIGPLNDIAFLIPTKDFNQSLNFEIKE
ncbi:MULTISPECIES: hypothetical protein [Acinetobacter calcoaceticus/baumannii complex]|uniref:hypothetical protein n=1 Tax=Acinetobacter calcoaceticus/baumannii complex TaxID=909768 RepID=UPI00035ED2A1|nr:hypothetical protein [Acinetobacter baumannii]AWO16103.1 hypothetical protein DLD53_07645 [Acinetobacter baumannii]EKU7312843.1 hypothetical protein [Acinetobacter baumannii]ELY0556440.1 hypothetical protein [Acinetobacter baumannii]ELY1733855.1 hypothetical protein [Acinetobacter baumannii]EMB9899825.1 hypothetical protein [Acinetobacter baumannii]